MQFDYLKHVTDGLDRDAVLNELMAAFGRDVWNFAFFMTRSREMADDVAQDVFVKVYQQLYEFRGQSTIKTWLLAITRNTARDVLRSAWVRRVVLFDRLYPHAGTSPSAERESMDKLMAEEIWAVVLKLPRKLREVLLMNSHYGLSMKEMADVLQVSVGTVKSRLHRARAAVNRRLAQEASWTGEEEWT
ncbi:sigma-70 family RNA polymerase sigma factor [Paenibacillus lycopersici]|uniref:RNA polymerase sigma factor n=1 Tax=Paenibacillus lycopersici TaxID=2704462 RepID=A0A6C0FRH3_9BACL|nr:sigma-70 family RNA polymerase sigma factor [Paenibacillus lycopersici]